MKNANDSDADWVCQMAKILMHLDSYSKDVLYRPKYDEMRRKFYKYWKQVPVSLALASIMDPRYKMDVLDLCKSTKLTKTQKVCKRKLIKLYEEYCQTMNSSVLEFTDLLQYLEEPLYKVEKSESFDILDWWKAEERTYPILSTIAHDLLTKPANGMLSINACESLVRLLHCPLKLNMVNTLISLREWFMDEDNFQIEDPTAWFMDEDTFPNEDPNDIEEMMERLDL